MTGLNAPNIKVRQLLGPVKTKNYIDSLLQKTKNYLPLFLGGKENQTIDFLINQAIWLGVDIPLLSKVNI
jgi:hypothetical protein